MTFEAGTAIFLAVVALALILAALAESSDYD